MSRNDKIGAKHFFGQETFVGLLIGIIICAIFLAVYGLIVTDPAFKQAEFKKYLFYSTAFRLSELSVDGGSINTSNAITTSLFLRNELNDGKTIENIITEENKIRPILEAVDVSDEQARLAAHFVAQGARREIVALAQNKEWKAFRQSPNNIKVLKELLAGEQIIPEIFYPKNNTKLLFWISVFIIQISVFISYLVRISERFYLKWNELQWNKVGTYVVIVLLTPAMWVIVSPWLLWKLFSFDFSGFMSKRREAKSTEKEKRRKDIETGFNANVLRGKFSEHRKESEALLLSLESKLQKEKGKA